MHRYQFMRILIMPFVMAVVLVGCGQSDFPHTASRVVEIPNERLRMGHPLPPERMREPRVTAIIQVASDGKRDAFIGSRNITQFSNPQRIYDAQVSPDDRYLFVWHMDYSPRKVSVYDLEANEKIATFEPGAGGSLAWAAEQLIFHRFGAGINTALWGVYTVDGELLWQGNTSGASLCESGQYVFSYPTLNAAAADGISVAKIRTGEVVGQAYPQDILTVVEHRWIDGRTVRFWYEDLERMVKTIDIETAIHDVSKTTENLQ